MVAPKDKVSQDTMASVFWNKLSFEHSANEDLQQLIDDNHPKSPNKDIWKVSDHSLT